VDKETEARVAEWLEKNGYTVYADYRDELPIEAVSALLEGDDEAFSEKLCEVTDSFFEYADWDSHRDDLITALGLSDDIREDEDFEEAFEEGRWIDDSEWIKTAARNTRLHITATPHTGEALKSGERIFEEDQDERLLLFPHGYCSPEENERRAKKLAEVIGMETPEDAETCYEFDEMKILGTLNVADLIENGPPTHIRISPEMTNEIVTHNAVNGSGGLGTIKPTKTILLPAIFEVDNGNRYGVDAVFGFVGEVWAKELPVERVG
jgi:hypothetical protein